jgi:hypothetical protein
MATSKIVKSYGNRDNKSYASYLRKACGQSNARAQRSDAGKKRK